MQQQTKMVFCGLAICNLQPTRKVKHKNKNFKDAYKRVLQNCKKKTTNSYTHLHTSIHTYVCNIQKRIKYAEIQ